MTRRGFISLTLFALLASCDGPTVELPVKAPPPPPPPAPPAAPPEPEPELDAGATMDTDDQDDEAEEATRGQPCMSDADCPGPENDVCSRSLGCVECVSNADCAPNEICIRFIGDCEEPLRRP